MSRTLKGYVQVTFPVEVVDDGETDEIDQLMEAGVEKLSPDLVASHDYDMEVLDKGQDVVDDGEDEED